MLEKTYLHMHTHTHFLPITQTHMNGQKTTQKLIKYIEGTFSKIISLP